MSSGRTGTRFSVRPVAARIAATIAGVLEIEPLEHSVASYLKGAQVRDPSGVIDEFWMQAQGGRFGPRWRLFFPVRFEGRRT